MSQRSVSSWLGVYTGASTSATVKMTLATQSHQRNKKTKCSQSLMMFLLVYGNLFQVAGWNKLNDEIFRYSDVQRASWHNKSPATRLIAHELIQLTASTPFVMDQWILLTKGRLYVREVFPFHDVIMQLKLLWSMGNDMWIQCHYVLILCYLSSVKPYPNTVKRLI